MRIYRMGNFFYRHNIPLLPLVCDALLRIVHNSAVFSSTDIGAETKFGYGGIAIVIHRKAVIGKRCMIGSCVTIGGKSGAKKLPVIGDDCYIATGAKILGNVKVGNGVVVGANAVVVTDVPDNCIVAGIPAKIIKTNINSRDYF